MSNNVSTSIVNLVVESVMALINAMNLYATIKRGALGTSTYLACEISPFTPQTVFMDKNAYIPITLTINGKHANQQTLLDALNNITDGLSRKTSYTSGNGWEIVDITSGNYPRIIGREQNNDWVAACDIVIKFYRKDKSE